MGASDLVGEAYVQKECSDPCTDQPHLVSIDQDDRTEAESVQQWDPSRLAYLGQVGRMLLWILASLGQRQFFCELGCLM